MKYHSECHMHVSSYRICLRVEFVFLGNNNELIKYACVRMEIDATYAIDRRPINQIPLLHLIYDEWACR